MEQFALHTDLFADDNLSHFDFNQYQALTASSNVQNQTTGEHLSCTSVQNPSQVLGSIAAPTQDFVTQYSDTNAPHTSTSQLLLQQPTQSVHVTNSLFGDDHLFSTSKPHEADSSENGSCEQPTLEQTVDQSAQSGDVTYGEAGSPGTQAREDQSQESADAAEQLQIPNVEELTSINNVVCTYSTRCHLNLKRVALEGCNVIFKRENNMVNMKLRKPKATASIWSSGKITCTGSESEDGAHTAARRIARQLQKMGFRVRFANYKVVNVLGTCFLPFAIKLTTFSEVNRKNASYEPELHPGVTYKMKEPKATLKIFSTGSITVTAPRVANVYAAIRNIYPLVYPHKLAKSKLNPRELELTSQYLRGGGGGGGGGGAGGKPRGKDRYQQFRYMKRPEGEDSYDSESSYGEDSDSD